MVEINLLPWRQLQYDYQLKMLKIMIGSVVAIVLMIVGARYVFFAYQIDETTARVDTLQHQIEQLSKQKENKDQYTEADKIKTLQFNDATIKSLFVQLGLPYDHEVCFTSITRHKNKLSFVGRTRSPADLTNFLRAWQAANLFTDLQIERLERDAKPNMFFHFQANMQSSV